MRTQNKNRQKLYVSNKVDKVPIYERDENGDIKYIMVDGKLVPIETGEFEIGYSYPRLIYGNISLSGSEATPVEYGLDISGYDAKLQGVDKPNGITETSLIWHKSPLVWKDRAKTIINPNSADYRVTRVSPSINEDKFLLTKVAKNG